MAYKMERRSRAEKHWIQFELKDFYLIDGIRYQPRPSGGTNGIITEYKVEVSNDGVHFEEAATGTGTRTLHGNWLHLSRSAQSMCV